MSASDTQLLEFEPHRRRLIGLAYRMLGSLAEAEDVVQDAFLRVRDVPVAQVAEPASYLAKTVARLCLDRLKSARARRELYVGTWLPEPLVERPDAAPDAALERADDLSFALLMMLERLSPPERTAFLLHDVFGMDFASIAPVLERTEAAVRKLAERARDQVHAGRPRFEVDPAQEQQLIAAFLQASATGDVNALMQLLAHDAVLYSDGGGKRLAALNPIFGAERITRFLAGILRKSNHPVPNAVELRRVNGMPGCVVSYDNGDIAVAVFELAHNRIERIYIVSNPDKLTRVHT
ncbi:MAG TPA: sigma-70 family RNA polymerase sigma factor [Polyangiales bacterium]|nr:sigma-70 family RNA polymerase sigma factor [Polyangiales bacterium]